MASWWKVNRHGTAHYVGAEGGKSYCGFMKESDPSEDVKLSMICSKCEAKAVADGAKVPRVNPTWQTQLGETKMKGLLDKVLAEGEKSVNSSLMAGIDEKTVDAATESLMAKVNNEWLDDSKKAERAGIFTDRPGKSNLDSQEGGDHYKKYGMYQPWAVFAKWLSRDELRGYMKGTVIAYLAREQDKGKRQDIKKALHTIQLYLELSECEEK